MLVGEIGFAEVNVHKAFLLGFLAIFSTMTNWFQSLYCILKERVQHFHLPEGITEIFLYQNPISCFNAGTEWNLRSGIYFKKLRPKKNTTQWKLHFGTLKGKGKYCDENTELQSTFMLGKTRKSHTMLSKKKIDSEHKPLKKEDYYCGLHLRVILIRKSYERLNVLAPKEVKWTFFVHVVLICYVNLKYIFHPSAIVWLRLT